MTGTIDWTMYTIELPVDASVKNINFGALLPGDGTAGASATSRSSDLEGPNNPVSTPGVLYLILVYEDGTGADSSILHLLG